MTDKLRIIKDILKIVISLFVISIMIKSCSKAYTFDEFIEFCQQIKDANISNTFTYHANKILIRESQIRSKINVNNYTSWVVDTYNSNSGTTMILLYTNSMNISVNSSNNGTITPRTKRFNSKFKY